MALSVGSIRFVSSTDATQATRFLTLTLVGLTPTEHASFCWTHPFPDHPFVGSWSVFTIRARNGFDITADKRDDFTVGHVVVVIPRCEFYQSQENDELYIPAHSLTDGTRRDAPVA
jgi:hypothetical protein